jgi:predicted  nucleic acid-binding Zn-ribbon protein
MGCGDKEAEARAREQRARITELQAKVDVLSARLGTPEGGNPEEDLKTAQSTLDEANQQVEALRGELASLTKQRTELEREFDAYKRKYRIPK